MARVDALLIGAGMRGRFVYGRYALDHPERMRIVALAEPDPERRQATAAEHGLAPDRIFASHEELLAAAPPASVAIVATGDTAHTGPALLAIERGYDLLLEKPIAPTAAECVRIVEAAERGERLLQIGHVLRYTPFYRRVRALLHEGRLGEVVNLDLKEHVATWHMTHSYVRGKFRRRADAAPLILAKACHDLDLLCWFAGRPAERVASYGGLHHYRESQAPEGAPARCSDGCPVQESCPHDAVRFYAGPDDVIAALWPWSDVSADPSKVARMRALETGRYGRCVYHCDNDVVDHQVTLLEFEGGVTATFTVHGHATDERRTLRVTGTRGELRGVLQTGEIELTRHGHLGVERLQVESPEAGHHGGDAGLLGHFTEIAGSGRREGLLASGRASLDSHLIGFAAEEARLRARSIDLPAFRADVEAALRGS
ncbi:MAG: Gfo/Idh/MocA family oxidoreductase [Myxococcota bacterium]|nr:Gfo/Idh/MocA family oxidoreductase [Myxococcota bacterium]